MKTKIATLEFPSSFAAKRFSEDKMIAAGEPQVLRNGEIYVDSALFIEFIISDFSLI